MKAMLVVFGEVQLSLQFSVLQRFCQEMTAARDLASLFLSCLGAGIAGFLLRPCFVTGYLLKRGLFFALKLS